jgi:hypothetical protein
MPSRKSKERGSKKRKSSKSRNSGSRNSSSGIRVKEYSMKVFAPAKYRLNAGALDAIFPSASAEKRKSKSAGKNYIIKTSNEDDFMNLMSRYKTFFD